MNGIQASAASPIDPARSRRPRSPARAVPALLAAALLIASCERTPTKAEYVDDRIAVECDGRSGEAFGQCRLEVIKKYMHVPLEAMQQQFPAPVRKDRMGCS